LLFRKGFCEGIKALLHQITKKKDKKIVSSFWNYKGRGSTSACRGEKTQFSFAKRKE